MRYRVAFLACIFLLLGAAVMTPPAHARSSVSVSFFYDSLAPYGNWQVSADYGYVWRPAGVSMSWRPYADGQWVYTDYGWTMLSDQPWGWAAYHYGRWYFDPRFGWVWVPGTEWAPAWVSFYQGGGYVGWAPLPPNVSVSVAIGGRLQLDASSYCFVDERHFADRNVRQWVMPSSRNRTLVRTTVNVTRYSRSGDRWINRSVPIDRIERVTNRRIERRHIVDVVESRGAARPQVLADHVALFRPQVSSRVTHPPANLHRESAPTTRRQSSPPVTRRPSSVPPPSSGYRPKESSSSQSSYRPQSSAHSQPDPRYARYQSAPSGKRAPDKGSVSKRSDDKKKHKGPPPPHH